MGEKLDRELQRTILQCLSYNYPRIAELEPTFDITDSAITVNVRYLEEHGLLTAQWVPDQTDGDVEYPADARITARGLDFLADDGGLGAVLGVVSVKLHDDTLRALLVEKVKNASGDPSAKDLLIEEIKKLPAGALSTVARRLLDSGIDHLPTALGALRHWLPL